MKLRYAVTSPYVRKVLVVAMETGLDKRIEKVPATVTPTAANADVAKENPLGKIPALTIEGGETLYDSRVICEYLDSLHSGAKLFPASGGRRWRALRQQALADGILDAGILTRYETFLRPKEMQWPDWIQGQLRKATQGLAAIEQEADSLGDPLDIGQIAIGCAIGWLEFRKPAGEIRPTYPKLFKWYDKFSQRPSMTETVPKA